jgi:hypothetical protein
MSVSVCTPKFDAFHKVSTQGDEVIISGTFAPLWQVFYESIRGLNATIIQGTAVGSVIDIKTAAYSGCMGAMQQNETDILFSPITGITFAPNISITVIDGYDVVGIASAYLRSNSMRDSSYTHVIDLIFGFQYDLWILTFFTATILMMFMSVSLMFRRYEHRVRHKFRAIKVLRLRLRCHISQSADAFLALTFRQSTKTFDRHKTATHRILFFLMDLFLFYCIFYLTSMIKTDMVIIKPPVLIQSYQDILDTGVRPLWLAIANDMKEFANAKPGSLEHKIWQRANSMGINDSLIKSSMDDFIQHAMQVAARKEVLFMQRLIGEKITTHDACAFSRTKGIMTDVNGLYRTDPGAKEKMNAQIANHLFVKSDASDHVNHRNQLIFEADLISASRRFFDFNSILQSDNLDQNYRSIMECCSDTVMIPSPEWQPVSLIHYSSLLLLTLVCIIASLFVIIREV